MRQSTFARGLLVLMAALFVRCATTREEIPAGDARVRYIDLAHNLELSLASESMEPFRSQRENGTLPRGLKLIPNDQIAGLLGFMRSQKFWEYAANISPDDPGVRGKTKGLIVLETGGETLTFAFASNPGNNPSLGLRADNFVAIKKRIIEVFEETTQFSGVR